MPSWAASKSLCVALLINRRWWRCSRWWEWGWEISRWGWWRDEGGEHDAQIDDDEEEDKDEDQHDEAGEDDDDNAGQTCHPVPLSPQRAPHAGEQDLHNNRSPFITNRWPLSGWSVIWWWYLKTKRLPSMWDFFILIQGDPKAILFPKAILSAMKGKLFFFARVTLGQQQTDKKSFAWKWDLHSG